MLITSCLFLPFFGLLVWFIFPCYGWREVGYIEELALVFLCSVMSIFFFILRWEDRKWSRIVYINFSDEYIDNINTNACMFHFSF